MNEWERTKVSWRQGHLLSSTDALRLGLVLTEFPDTTLALVISHDCDIANDVTREPTVEIILGHLLNQTNPNLVFAKNPRILELPFQGSPNFYAEFNIHDRCVLSKSELKQCQPYTAILQPNNLRILRSWLAARYDRPAFPDNFDQALKDAKLHIKLASLGKTYGHFVSGLLFDLQEDEIYQLGILVLYVTTNPSQAQENAEKYSLEIQKSFEAKFFNAQEKNWHTLELTYCRTISEDDLTLGQSRDYQRWHLDAASLAADPQQKLLPD